MKKSENLGWIMNIVNKQANKNDKPEILNNKESHAKESGAVLEYQKPVLISYGDVRDITLGPSPGFGESGAGVFFLQP